MKDFDDYEAAIGVALPEARRGVDAMGEYLAELLARLSREEAPVAREWSATALFGLADLDTARGRHEQAQRRRDEAVALLDRVAEPGVSAGVADLIADELLKQGENRRALVYCNRAVALSRGAAAALGVRLLRAGRCHRRIGFIEPALAQLREAIALFRRDDRIPLLPHTLLELGATGAKVAPAEAAAALREAAGMFEAKGDFVNAGVAFLNLGVTLAQVGDLDGALDAYEKTAAIRARHPATTRAQRGNLRNNVAGVYRRKRDFARARAESREAIALLKTVGGEFLAHAYGTMGEIARDEGLREEALQGFVAARELYERLPGVSAEKLAVKLENEAEALAALGHAGEASKRTAKALALRGEAAPPSPKIPTVRDDAPLRPGWIVIELDGISLPDEVYATCDLASLEDRLETALGDLGEVEGHRGGPATTEIHLVGDNLQAMFAAIEPTLRGYPLCRNAQIVLKQGEETTRFALDRRRLN